MPLEPGWRVTYYVIALVAPSIFIQHHPVAVHKTQKKITAIEIETRPGFVRNPNVFTAKLTSDGRLKFSGSPGNDHAGTWTAVFPAEEFSRLSECVDKLGFWGFKPSYRKPITDQPSAIVTVRKGTAFKSVENYANAAPAGEWALEILIKSLIDDASDWKQTGPKPPIGIN